MAFWIKQEVTFAQMQEIVVQRPGITATELARVLGVAPSTVHRRLPGMADAGYLLAEDDRGGLWPFGKGKG